ncbi:MAG: ribosome maturation factor RimP [Proteobacteria bacterium]|nr:MAG: ribosome maturation factor RimP [Pseudomonadota bacterium]
MSDSVTERVRLFAESLLPSLGLELYDIQFRREGQGWVLRLMIDSLEGVSLDDCSRVSREVGDFLDVEDLISHPYNLEISSPGAERTLRNRDECCRFVGSRVRLKLREEQDGQRVIIGMLESVDDQELLVKMDDGREIGVLWDTIKKARLTL